jgi:1-acyl-sn-glycerol-3-phosphate acyltransferase
MIKAAPRNWFKKIWRWYIRYYQLWRYFSAVKIKGEIDPPTIKGEKPPVIYIANHTSWWDGFVAYEAYTGQSKYDHYIMMEEQNLRQFRFFTWAGVFSINKDKQSAIIESLRYAIGLLEKKHAVWLFPQGKIEHLEKRPLQFFSGVSYMLQHCPQAVVKPVTLYYSFGTEQKPEASIYFGEPIRADWTTFERKEVTTMLQAKLEQQLDMHRSWYVEQSDSLSEWSTMIRSSSTDRWFLTVKKWVKRWFLRSP